MASSTDLGHLELAAAKFVGGVCFREQAAGSEELVERESAAEKRDGTWEARRVSIILADA